MSRSLRVRQDYIKQVKSAVSRNGFPRQRDLAEDLEISLATVSNFLNGRPVDYLNFVEICRKLAQDWQEIANLSDNSSIDIEHEAVITEPYQDEQPFIYVERPPIESRCYETLLQPGSLVRIKAPSLMGKTLLMARVLAQLEKQDCRTVSLNLHMADRTDFTNLDKFLRWFCVSVGQSLGLPNQLADYWDEQFSTPKVNCTDYFEQYLLPKAGSSLVLCLDEVDRVFPHSEVAQDFLSLLRAWHEQAKIRNIWRRLRLVVVHSTEVYIPLNINESPFNVGLAIELPELTLAQVQDLAQQHELNWNTTQLNQLIDIVGGHPYLVEQALCHLRNCQSITLDQLLQTAATEAGIYSNHLRRYWYVLQQHPELAEALKKVVSATSPVRLESKKAYKLQSMGLVQLQGDDVTPRCNLYRQYFCDRVGVTE